MFSGTKYHATAVKGHQFIINQEQQGEKAMKKIVMILLLVTAWAMADVKQATTSKMEFGGTLGKMMKFFGAGRPMSTVDYYKSDMKRSDSIVKDKIESSQIVDLGNELFININHKDKEYTQMTFEEWRQMMRETLESLKEGKEEKPEQSDTNVKWNVKFDVKDTGEKEEVSGRSTDKVILALEMEAEVTSQEEGKTPETARTNLIVTSTEWLYRGEDKAQKEMQAFQVNLAKKLGFSPDDAAMQSMMTQVFVSYPQLAKAMERLQKESDKLAGFAMRVNTVYESEPDPATAQRMKEEKQKQEKPDNQIPTSVGGLVGGIGKKMIQKKMEQKQEPSDRTTLMKNTLEVTELATSSIDADLFEIPAGYKLVKTKEN
jgi:hypothetical protein